MHAHLIAYKLSRISSQKEATLKTLRSYSLVVTLIALLLSPLAAAAAGPLPPQSDAAAKEVEAVVAQLQTAGNNAPEVWNLLPAHQKDLVKKWLSASTFETQVTDTLAPTTASTSAKTSLAAGCGTVTLARQATNSLGQTLWTYYESVYRCFNGSTVSSISRNRWGTVNAVMWFFRGNIGSNTRGGNGQSSYYAWTQGRFELCLVNGIGCAQQVLPWIWITVYGSGTYSYGRG
jgi:hypothetical protein